MSALTNRDKTICSYAGLFGIMLTLTATIQLFVIGKDNSTVHWIFALYLYCLVAFIMFAAQHYTSPYLLLTTVLAVLIVDVTIAKHGLYSLAVLLLFIYCIAISLFIIMDGLHLRLWRKNLSEQAEEDKWRDKI
jgi:hypothetical protein